LEGFSSVLPKKLFNLENSTLSMDEVIENDILRILNKIYKNRSHMSPTISGNKLIIKLDTLAHLAGYSDQTYTINYGFEKEVEKIIFELKDGRKPALEDAKILNKALNFNS
jgi:hypothetical protein